MLRDEVVDLCKVRYPGYSVLSFNEDFITIKDQSHKRLTIELDYKDSLNLICPNCHEKNYRVQTKNKKEVYDIGYKDYLISLKIPNYYFKCNNKNCLSIFSVENDIVMKSKNFSNAVRNVIYENSELPCREIAHKLWVAYKVKISFDQVNQILKELENEQKIFEVKKDIKKLESEINNQEICKLFSYSNNPADYFLDIVFSKYDFINIFKKYLISKNKRETKYSNVLYITSSISSRLRNQIATYLYPLALTSETLIDKIGYNILKMDESVYFATSTFLRNLYKFTSKEIMNDFNGILKDMNNLVKPNTKEYIIDSTKLEVNPNIAYEQMGEVRDDDNNKHYGYKITVMYAIKNQKYNDEVNNILLPLKAQIDPINIHDANIANNFINPDLLEEGSTIILDRGYTDKIMLYNLVQKGIYITMPAKKNSNILRDSLSLVGVLVNDISKGNQKEVNEAFIDKISDKEVNEKLSKIRKSIIWENNPIYVENDQIKQEITLVKDLELNIDGIKNIKINVALIRYKRENERQIDKIFGDDDKKVYYYDKNYNYAAIYTTNTKMAAKEIVLQYSKRMLVESQIKQGKQEWKLTKLNSKRITYICYHVMATILAMNIFQIFKTTEEGKKYGNHTISLVKSLIEPFLKENSKVFIASRTSFNDYSLKDFLKLFQSKNKTLQDKMIEVTI